MDKYIGKRLDGRYEIHELLGVGGMAYVYKAYDNIEKRWVAIKILKEELAGNSDFLRRFRNESKAIAVLSHPNIVKVYDVSFGDRIQYIVMEYIDGITLKQYIEQQGEIKWREALYFTVQILRALQHAHEKGIIHRDIKPQNIMLLQDGTIKVTDFGIARFSSMETRTMTDKAIGSVHYIAPEQARGGGTEGVESDFPRMFLPPCKIIVQNDGGADRIQDLLALCAKGAALIQNVGGGAGGLALVPHAYRQAAPDFDRLCQLAALDGAFALGTIHVQRQAVRTLRELYWLCGTIV